MNAASEIEWGRSPLDDDRIVLEAMLHTEDRGAYAVLASFMSRLGKRLSESPDNKIRMAYLELASRAEEAFKYESKYGRRSLMKWDHPDNIEWVRIGLIRLSETERKAFETSNGFAAHA